MRVVLDRRALAQRLDGDEELCEELIQMYVEDSANQLREIRRAAAADDAEALERAAHTLKGASANIEAPAVRDTARDLEAAAREKRLDATIELVRQLEHDLEELWKHVTDESG